MSLKVGLFGKKYDETMHQSLQKLVSSLERHGIEIFVFSDFYSLIKNDITFSVEPYFFGHDGAQNPKQDFLFSIGGDGTLLKTVALLGRHNVPIVGVNLGHLGFLTTISSSNLDEYVAELIKGNYTIEERSLLHVDYWYYTGYTNRLHSIFT